MLKFVFIMLLLSMAVGFIYGTYTRKQKEKAAAEEAFRKKAEYEERERKRKEENEAREKRIAQKTAEAGEKFNALLASIPTHEVVKDPGAARKPLAECEKVEHSISGISKNTNREKLGQFVVIDTETTGLHCVQNQIVELTAIRFRDWKPVEIFTTLINPGSHIPEDATRIHGITDEMVKDAPKIGEVIKSFDSFLGSDNLLGHNISFDLGFLDMAGSEYSNTKRKYYDTLTLAQYLDLYVDNNKLTTLCDHYYIRDNSTAHRSASDALATGLLFDKLVEQKMLR